MIPFVVTPMTKTLIGICLLLLAPSTCDAFESLPNILWITAEDMSPNLGCYGDPFATTPNLDRFAEESTRYTHAFATAPVCSPARSCLITGMYATSLGTQRLRSHFPIPGWCRPFPEILRDAGYFTTNNVKTDYNVRDESSLISAAWNRNGVEAHWRQRDEQQPFFAVFNLMTTHQSRTGVWPQEQFESDVASQLADGERHASEGVPLPPFYPDTPIIRRGMSRYYDCVAVMDQQVGRILQQLEDDGLAEDTIVFFFSDHGMGLPRGKRVLHDSGLHVPLMIRIPEKFRSHLEFDSQPVSDRIVSFVDFAPTVLRLAGLEIPKWMQGRPFLGRDQPEPRAYAFGARDRVDEVYDLSRSVRGGRFLYIRNYMPHLSWMQPEWYSDHSDLRRELFRLRTDGQLGPGPMGYAAAQKQVEELYDTVEDPYQINNLATDARFLETLEQMRNVHRKWELATHDVGFLPESEVWERMREDTPWDLANDNERYAMRDILAAAQEVGRPLGRDEQAARLANDDAAVRFWAVVGLRNRIRGADDNRSALQMMLTDESPAVRIEAAAALLSLGNSTEAARVLNSAIRERNVDVVLRATRAFELNRKTAKPDLDAIRRLLGRATEQEMADSHPSWMFVRFSADSILNR